MKEEINNVDRYKKTLNHESNQLINKINILCLSIQHILCEYALASLWMLKIQMKYLVLNTYFMSIWYIKIEFKKVLNMFLVKWILLHMELKIIWV